MTQSATVMPALTSQAMLLSGAHLLSSCRKTYATSYTRRLATYPAPRPSKPLADAASARWMRRAVW